MVSLWTKIRIVCIAISLFFSLLLISEAYQSDSAEDGECFTVHGRLSIYNGTPSYRIWIVGTKRLLGVAERDEVPDMPDNLLRMVRIDADVYGDFSVCPVTKYKLGEMQIVSIKSESNVLVKKRSTAAEK